MIDYHVHVRSKSVKEDIKEILKNMNKYNISESYLMSTYFPLKGSGVSNFNLFYHIKNIKNLKMWASLDFETYFWMGYNEINSILNINKEKIIGFKIYTGYQVVDINSKKMNLILELAREYKKPIMFHTGFLENSKEIFDISNLEKLIIENEDIEFIFAHLGNPRIKKMIKFLNKYKNLKTDISGLIEGDENIINFWKENKVYIKKIKNKKQILFGTDYPIQSYEETFKIWKKISKI